MSRIKILPEILSNQIAAGEVVERPVSVVKELIENSIDANATIITIETERGGKSLIRVSDNGIGLSRDDALLSIERYATSKISTTSDLFSIATMGFRGEALPSMASVSRFTMVTRTQHSNTAVKIDISGGKLVSVEDAGGPVGTMVEVKNLFYNTPARKKFLKSDATEISHIADMVSGVALGNPKISFKLVSNKKVLKKYSDSNQPFQRAAAVLGKETATRLFSIDHKEALIQVKGFCAHPLVSRSTSNKIYFFVNNRLVHDRGLMAALFQGLRGRIMKGRYPVAVLFLNLPFDQVDINVHPAKKEVRFYNAQNIYQAVSTAVYQSFLNAQKDVTSYSGGFQYSAARDKARQETAVLKEKYIDPMPQNVAQSVIAWPDPLPPKGPAAPAPEPAGFHAAGSHTPVEDSVPEPDSIEEPSHGPSVSEQPKVIGQVMNTYIIAETDSSMMLIDQHAAHERIQYETLKKKHDLQGVVSQRLVVPETLELTHKEAEIFELIKDELFSLGFEIEPFGGTTYIVKSIPDMISGQQVEPLITDIIEKTAMDKNCSSKDQWLKESLVLTACHSALRANQVMHRAEMEALLSDLWQCENPMHCPHGRPIVITLTKTDLEKQFKRIV